MPIIASNILDPERLIQFPSDSRQILTMPQIAVRKKVLDILRSTESADNDLVKLFMAPAVQSVILRKQFDNASTICACVTPDGMITEYDGNGQVRTDSSVGTLHKLSQDWRDMTITATQPCVGLVVEENHYATFLANHDANLPDKRFSSALNALKLRVQESLNS